MTHDPYIEDADREYIAAVGMPGGEAVIGLDVISDDEPRESFSTHRRWKRWMRDARRGRAGVYQCPPAP